MRFWPRVLINGMLFIALTGFFQMGGNFYVSGIWIALVASFILAVLNASIRPILQIISLPITVLTLGLFSIVINALMLELTSAFVGSNNFHFSSFGMTMLISVILSICNTIISNHFINNR
jgi:putative membrane protein